MSPGCTVGLRALSVGSRWIRRAGEEVVVILHVYGANLGTPEEPVVLLVYETAEGEARPVRSNVFLVNYGPADNDGGVQFAPPLSVGGA